MSEKAISERALDRLFSTYIRERDVFCQAPRGYCRPGALACDTAHHLRRGFKGVRWDPLNATGLCRACHQWYTKHPLAWTRFWQSRIGPVETAKLIARSLVCGKPNLAAFRENLEAIAGPKA